MQSVELRRRYLDDYRGIVPNEFVDDLRDRAEPIEGKRILHVNATSFGGGVAELLHSLVPLMRDLGLEAHWKVIEGDDDFFWTTKTLHNGLQGADVAISKEMQDHYLQVNRRNAEELEDEWDFVVVHDPQPAAVAKYSERDGMWIWRCHIDLTSPNSFCLSFLSRLLNSYDASVFSLRDYIPPDIDVNRQSVIHPSIDPLSSKNRPMSPMEIESVADDFGVDLERPIVSSVGRFDPWKDPLGVIDIYREVKGQLKDLQLLLIASMAHDDPEGWEYYEKALRRAGEDTDIFFLTNLNGVGGREVNAFQRSSSVSLLKSRREGFGLVVSESLWKGVPVVGWRAGGIPLQIVDGETGYLVEDSESMTQRTMSLLQDEGLAGRMGEAGKAHVRENFLITRHLRDYVDLLLSLQ